MSAKKVNGKKDAKADDGARQASDGASCVPPVLEGSGQDARAPGGVKPGEVLVDLPMLKDLMLTRPEVDVLRDLRGKMSDRTFKAVIDFIRYRREEALVDVTAAPEGVGSETLRTYNAGMVEGLMRIELGLLAAAFSVEDGL